MSESEASTSKSSSSSKAASRSPTKRPTSPTKTSRGRDSPDTVIPKFNIEDVEDDDVATPAEKEDVVVENVVVKETKKTKKSNAKSQPEVVVEEVVEVIEEEVVEEKVEEKNYAAMLKKDLLKEASSMGIEVDSKATKAVIIASLQAGVKPATKEEKIVEEPVSQAKTAAKSRRGRVEIIQEGEVEDVVTPVKNTKGKKVKETKKKEETVIVEEESVTKPTRGRKGGKKVEEQETPAEVVEEEEAAAPLESAASPNLKKKVAIVVEAAEEDFLKKPARGGRKTKAAKAEIKRVAVEDLPEFNADPCGTCKKKTRGITWDCQVNATFFVHWNF